jgi:outer membrane receptor protein involved in Fe transport
MQGSIRRRFVALVAVLFLFAISAPAFADDVADEADLQFTLGAERYQAGEYRAALQHFLASNRLVANRNVIFNIARTYEQLKQYPDAYRYYVRALEGENDAPTRKRIEDAMKRVAPNVAVLKVDTDPPGAKVFLDRKDLGERGNTPQRLGLPPGKYKVIVELAGYEDAEQQAVDVRIGSETQLSLKLTRILATVRVEGDAVGASVRVDSEDSPVLGTVPGSVQIPPGRHTLFISRPGFQTTTIAVEVKPRSTTVVRPQITAQMGKLVVDADERDALIEIDGQPQGFTPSVLTVPVGTHRVRISLKGFRTVERAVQIDVGTQARIDVQLLQVSEVEAASRAAEAVEDAPSSVSIVPHVELRAMQYPTLAEALRGTRGVYVTDDRGYVSLGFRGFGRPGDYGNRVLVLLNGQPMNDNWLFSSYVGFDLRTDLEDIERIEVVRGPGSVLYGTSAFSGVVNMVTRGRDAPEGWEVGVSTAEYGMARGRVRVTKKLGDDAGAWVSFSGGHSSGRDFFFPEYVADGPSTIAGNARGVDGADVGTFTGQFWWKALSMQWSFNSHRKQLPTGEFDTILGDERTRQTDTRGMFEVRFDPKISDTLQSLSRVHMNYYGYRGTFAHLPPAGTELDLYDGAWAGVEQRFAYTPTSKIRLTVGGEFQDHFLVHQFAQDEQSNTFLDDHRSFQLGAGYLLADVSPTERVKVSAGARLDAYSTFGTSLNPRAAVIFKPYDRGNVKIMAGKAFRAPSVYELFYVASSGQIPNPNVSPEDIYSGEVEYSHRFSNTTTGIVAAYGNYINGLIALRNVDDPTVAPGTYQYQNTKTPVATVGSEFELRREWKEGWMIAASVSLQRSQYMKSASLADILAFAPSHAQREVPNAPSQLASLKAAVPLLARALTAMTRFTFEGPRWDRNDQITDPVQTRTDPAVIWDLMFTGVEPRWGVRYALGFYNLFDWRWYAPVSTEFRQNTMLQAGRTVMASSSVTF